MQNYLTTLKNKSFNEVLQRSLLELYLDLERRNDTLDHHLALQSAKQTQQHLSAESHDFRLGYSENGH